MPMDAVVADFEAGAAEMLSPAAAAEHWDVIEGQGSLFHPAYAGVSLALLHGSQPDVIVVCHQPGRECMLGHADFALPSIAETIDLNLRAWATHQPGDSLRGRQPEHRAPRRAVGVPPDGAGEGAARPPGGGSDAWWR